MPVLAILLINKDLCKEKKICMKDFFHKEITAQEIGSALEIQTNLHKVTVSEL